jgi:hypothetical protein
MVVENAIRIFVAGLPLPILAKVSFATLTLSEADSMRIIALPTLSSDISTPEQ